MTCAAPSTRSAPAAPVCAHEVSPTHNPKPFSGPGCLLEPTAYCEHQDIHAAVLANAGHFDRAKKAGSCGRAWSSVVVGPDQQEWTSRRKGHRMEREFFCRSNGCVGEVCMSAVFNRSCAALELQLEAVFGRAGADSVVGLLSLSPPPTGAAFRAQSEDFAKRWRHFIREALRLGLIEGGVSVLDAKAHTQRTHGHFGGSIASEGAVVELKALAHRIFPDGDEKLFHFSELNGGGQQWTPARLARYLAKGGVRPEEVVGLTPELYADYLDVLLALGRLREPVGTARKAKEFAGVQPEKRAPRRAVALRDTPRPERGSLRFAVWLQHNAPPPPPQAPRTADQLVGEAMLACFRAAVEKGNEIHGTEQVVYEHTLQVYWDGGRKPDVVQLIEQLEHEHAIHNRQQVH